MGSFRPPGLSGEVRACTDLPLWPVFQNSIFSKAEREAANEMKTMIRKAMSSGGLALISLSLLTLAPTLASGQSFNLTPGGFTTGNVCANSTSPASSCQVLTNGSPSLPKVITGGILRLNAATTNQHASAWFYTPQPLSTGFTTSFQFRISGTGACRGCGFPADGLALVIQGDPAKAGAIGYTGNGQNVAYGNNDVSSASGRGRAILNSLAIELDTHQNTDYSDPNGNHIAVQSCGPNTASGLTPNSADHNYQCPNGQLSKLALQSLPASTNLSDGNLHTITVNYTAPANVTPGAACSSSLCVHLDSALVLQTNFDITQLLYLKSTPSNSDTPATGAYIGFTSATGASVQNNDIVSWSFSQLPLAPITITQPLQTTSTQFNYAASLTAAVDYSQSGLPPTSFTNVFMQGTSQAITDSQFADLVNNTPFQGSTCLHQDLGSGTFACVVTTDLCTNSASNTPSGANCPNTGTAALIGTSNTFNAEPAQKPITSPAYIMGKDTALNCGSAADNTCKGLQNIFESISGDPVLVGRTKDFNSLLIPIEGAVGPNTSTSTNPALNNGWTNGDVSLTFNSTEVVPTNNGNPPATLPTISSITYTISGDNAVTPITGTINGPTGSVTVPGAVPGTTTVTFQAHDNAGTNETVVTTTGNQSSTSLPSLTIKVDKTAPTFTCTPPASAWQASDVSVPCTASDDTGGSGLATPSSFNEVTAVPQGTETASAQTTPGSVSDIAGNTVPVPAYGPFQVDKKAPTITGPTVGTVVFGQATNITFSCADAGSGVVLCGPQGSSPIPSTANTGDLTSPADVSSAGPKTFTVNSQDAVGNASAPATLSYNVAPAKPVITWAAPAPITYGTALSAAQLNATASVPGTFVYTPAAGTVLSAGSQTLSVTFNPTDTVNYSSANAQVSLMVNRALPLLTWGTPAPIAYGTPLGAAQLNASANVLGTFVYVPAAGTVLTAGLQTLSVTFTPTDAVNYSTATAQVSLTVNRVTPTITWATPAPIGYGTPLSSAQLNASANVPGTFVYTPAAGTVLSPGNQLLSVVFTPSDSTDYNQASAQVTVLVTQPSLSFSPTSVNFGNVVLGKIVFTNIGVNNPGTGTVQISSIKLVRGTADLDDYGIVSNCPKSLAPGAGCVIAVQFLADDLGVRTASIVLTDTAAGSPQQIPLSATVVRKK